MEQQHTTLGLCLFNNQLYYAINQPDASNALARIGSFDFDIDSPGMLLDPSSKHFYGIKQTVSQLKSDHDIHHLRIHTPPEPECWTSVPKIVHDNADEREHYINILMPGIDRSNIQPTWFNLSNQNYKLLRLRNRANYRGVQELASDTSTIDLISDFEIGGQWVQHAEPGGSFMTVGCFRNCIAISSFILGKMRGATFFTFDDIQDLPYFWLLHTKELPWMNGLHEQIYVYGMQAFKVIEILESFWVEAGVIKKMNSLDKVQVSADEKTYGFNLEKAFPAMILALDYD